MTFCDLVNHQFLLMWPHDSLPLDLQPHLATVTDCITSAATLLASRVISVNPSTAIEVDVASDYDTQTEAVVADIYLRMIGTPPYSTFAVFLEMGFNFVAADSAFHANVEISTSTLGKSQ